MPWKDKDKPYSEIYFKKRNLATAFIISGIAMFVTGTAADIIAITYLNTIPTNYTSYSYSRDQYLQMFGGLVAGITVGSLILAAGFTFAIVSIPLFIKSKSLKSKTSLYINYSEGACIGLRIRY